MRTIYTDQQIKDSNHLKDLESYYKIFEEYISICIGLLALLNNFNKNDFINLATEQFVEDKFAGDEINEIKKHYQSDRYLKRTLYNSWKCSEI